MFIGTIKVELSAPLKWEGREIFTVELDFGKVSGAIINRCERETWGGGNASGMIRGLSSEYCSRMAALISGIPFRAMEKIPGDDFDKVWQTVGAYVSKRNPQEFYDQFTADDDEGKITEEVFTDPAVKPETEEK
jgi:hypothetical protein